MILTTVRIMYQNFNNKIKILGGEKTKQTAITSGWNTGERQLKGKNACAQGHVVAKRHQKITHNVLYYY